LGASDIQHLGRGRSTSIALSPLFGAQVIQEVEAERWDTDIFDRAETEISRILKHDSFERFKKHYIYDHLKRAFFVKFSQRNFVTGDTVKGDAARNSGASGGKVSGSWQPRETTTSGISGLSASGSLERGRMARSNSVKGGAVEF
jgi:hypothetical protein